MRKSLLYLMYMLFAASTSLVPSCGIEDVDAEDGAIVFELYDDDGSPIEGLQSMPFGGSVTYSLKSAYVTYVVPNAPAGWVCKVIPSSRSCTVTAPPASDLKAENGGTIEIAIRSQAGRTMTYSLAVAALEDDIKLELLGDAGTEKHIFSYGRSMQFFFSCENTSSLDIQAPAGWTCKGDVEKGTLTVTAPAKDTPDPGMKGTITVTPLSIRGTAGAASTIAVELSTKVPVIDWGGADLAFDFGEQRDIPCTIENVAECTTKVPAGWTVALDAANAMLHVTAPKEGTPCESVGKAVFDAVSAENLTGTFELNLRLRGIATGKEFVAFGSAVAAGEPLDAYTNSGRIVLIDDIDLRAFDENIFVGSADHPFTGTFDGQGHAIEVNFAAKQAEVGIFHTLAAEAAVKNLVLRGSLTWTLSDKRPMIGTLAVYNNGAPITSVTTQVSLNYTNDNASTKSYSWIGGLVCFSKGGAYTDCRNEGTFMLSSVRYVAVGGLVGRGEDDSTGSFTRCTNTGNFEMLFGELAVDSGRIGGIIGMAETAEWTYTDCTNSGAFRIDHGGTNKQFYSLGGILGNGYGTFENCVNRGVITMSNAISSNRRIGGIVGCVGSDKGKDRLSLKMTGCRNEADLTLATNYLGGLVGIAEKLKSGVIENCTNTGHITNPATATLSKDTPSQIGGIAGCAYGNCTIRGCVNRGNITGQVRYRAAGILAAVRNAGNRVENCENYGNLDIRTLEVATSPFPLVAGIVAVEQDVTVTIRTCKNTGSITATVKNAACADPVYVFQKAIESGLADKTDCDQASKDASAATVMHITFKE